MSRYSIRTLFLPLLLTCSMHLAAQSSGTIRGSVSSSAKGAVPNAVVTATGSANGSTRSVMSGPNGAFVLSGMTPGAYKLQVEAQGFKRAEVDVIDLQADGTITINAVLEPGSANETVQVKGYSSPLQDRSASSSRSYDGEYLRQLPLLDRNHQQGVELMPGITPPQTAPAIIDPQGNRVWNANGLPANSNYHGLDGVQSDEPARRLATHVPPLEGVEQFRVVTSDYDAARGRAGGSSVETLTKSGTNALHGSAFEYNSNAFTQARNYFNTKDDTQARYNFNMFGATVGGPIQRDRTFFFGSWEGRYLRQQIPANSTLPTAALRAGDFSAVPGLMLFDPQTGDPSGAGRQPFPGNVIPLNRVDPGAQSILNALPLPNRAGLEGNFTANVPFRNDSQRFDARIDHRFSDGTSVFGRYGYTNGFATQDSILGLIGSGLQGHLRSDSVVIGGTRNFGPSLLADLRIGYTRYDNDLFGAGTFASSGLGFLNNVPGNGALPFVRVAGMDTLGQFPNFPTVNKENTFNLTNSWTKTWSRHQIRWGADIWWTRLDGFQNVAFGPQGSFSFTPGATSIPGASLGQFGNFANSFASFLIGAPTSAGIAPTPARPSNLMTAAAGYVSDTVRVTDRLSLNWGLRYEFFTPIKPRVADGSAIYDPTMNQLVAIDTDGVDGRGNVHYQKRNFAPRFGFAFHAAKKTVIRGGYGIGYWNASPLFSAASFFNTNPGVQSGLDGTYAVAAPLNGMMPPAGVTPGQAPNAPLSFLNQNLPTPYAQTYSLMVQHEISQGMMFDVSYVGTLGRHLPSTRDLNSAAPGTGFAGQPFNTAFGRTAATLERGTNSNSNYNALQANLTRRFSQGLTLAAAYTYSRSFDYGAGFAPFLNNLDIRSNYGPSDFDRTHVVTISHAWNLPFGKGTNIGNSGWKSQLLSSWSLNGIFRFASGLPFTPIASSALCNCPGNTPRADHVVDMNSANGVFVAGFPIVTDDLSFVAPAPGQLGNAGRNVGRGRNFTNYDLAVVRGFSLLEGIKLELRGEAYNIANSPNFVPPVANVNSALFGQSLATVPGLGQRTVQFALRATF